MKSFELLARIALIQISTDDFALQINSLLGMTGRFTHVSRAYVFVDSPDGATTSNEFEWCSPGTSPQIQNLQAVPYSLIPSWREMLLQEGSICCEDIHELPEDLVTILEAQGIQSLVAYPLHIEGKVRGFIGFDDCTRRRSWEESELNLLRTICGVASAAYDRKKYREHLERSERNLKTLFDTIDDVLIIGSTDGLILHANSAVTRKLGYTLGEITGTPLLHLHPVECRPEAERILLEMFAGTRVSCPLPLRKRDGSLLPVETRVWSGSWDGSECVFGVCKDLTTEQEALQKFTSLFEHNPALMAISSTSDRRFVDVNQSFLNALGYAREEVIGKTAAELGLFVANEAQAKATSNLAQSGQVHKVELQVRCKDGSILDGLFSGELISTQGQELFLTVMVDITMQKRLQKALGQERERLTQIIEATQLGTWEWNVQTGETAFNERWAEIIGYSLEELAPVSIETWTKFTHPDDLAASNAQLQSHFRKETEHYECECRMRHKDGRFIWVLDRGKVIEWDPTGKPLRMFGTHSDVTERRQLLEQVRDASIRDPLTNLYNRRHALERLDALMQEYRRERDSFSVALLDIDHFKRLNDTHGHAAGDFALQQFSSVLSSSLRPYDLLARYGGEEFLVVSMHTSKKECFSVIDRVAQKLRGQRHSFDGSELSLTFSAGIADCSELAVETLDPSQLIALADQRMYRAKELGRARIVLE